MTLTDRYVATTLRGIPTDKRGDIDRELRASITDAIDAQVESGADPARAEEAVLTELGDPARLAADYSGRTLHLIGPDLYLDWRRLLSVLLWIAPIPGLVVFVLDAVDGASPIPAIGSGIWTSATVALHIAFWTTLVFAVLERTGDSTRNPTGAWTPERLPEIDDDRRVSLADTVISIAFYIFVFAFVVLQRDHSGFHAADGSAIPIIAPDLCSFWIPVLLGVLVLGAVLEVVRYAIGGWTIPLAAINTVLNLLFAIPLIALATDRQLVNPDYLAAAFGNLSGVETAVSSTVVVVVTLVAAWEIGEGWVKALRNAVPRDR